MYPTNVNMHAEGLADNTRTPQATAPSRLRQHVQVQRCPVESEPPERFKIWSDLTHNDSGFPSVRQVKQADLCSSRLFMAPQTDDVK